MSSKDLVIVESPAKARTIGRLIGGNYEVAASMGHVRDLPENSLGVDIKNNFKPFYEISARKGIIPALREKAKNAKNIYLASDPDREGEAISWHIKEILKKDTKANFRRVVFHEITSSALNKAFAHPGEINMNLVNAQQARRILDRIVGFQTSEFLWKKIEKGSSAGRVQSVALRIICEREREILAFKPQEYWNLFADFEVEPRNSNMMYRGKLSTINGEKFTIPNETEAQRIRDAIIKNHDCKIASVEIKDRKKFAPPPFITSTLQQAASSSLRFSASHTMAVAQQLYEGVELGSEGPVGLITYMRTDSVNIAQEAVAACRAFIAQRIGTEFVPEYPNKFKSSARAQEAHEAIRPTDIFKTPESVKDFLNADQLKLYTLIWRRFIACQMKPAEFKDTIVETAINGADNNNYTFKTINSEMVFPGFTRIYDTEDIKEESANEDEPAPADFSFLSKLNAGTKAFLLKTDAEQKFTEPPPRFSEASLIKELESNGIGRPSTYATIVNTIQKRKYVVKNKGKLVPTEFGFKVNDCLVVAMPSLFDVGFTAKMENALDDIEEGKIEWTEMLKEFYAKFAEWLGNAKTADVPEKDIVCGLFQLFSNVREWDKMPQASAKKSSDREFFNSLLENYKASGRLTERQWKALILLAAKYRNQIPGLHELAEKGGFKSELESASEYSDRVQTEIASGEKDAILEEQKKLIENALSAIKTEEETAKPYQKKRSGFDPARFLRSLKQHLAKGKTLSEKQIAAVSKIVARTQERAGQGAVASENNSSGSGTSTSQTSEDISKLEEAFKILSSVQKWDEPEKKGKRLYDDKAFFESVYDQFKSGKKLSPKQIYAIVKLSSKYKPS